MSETKKIVKKKNNSFPYEFGPSKGSLIGSDAETQTFPPQEYQLSNDYRIPIQIMNNLAVSIRHEGQY